MPYLVGSVNSFFEKTLKMFVSQSGHILGRTKHHLFVQNLLAPDKD